ncbi:Endonuclease/exonuclease/phosphatase [Chytriomyces cf. hyalinus JEL632]|nr:Endonuclease/exonuclease/phosphatase [Chytriomyces cf. hyalinus JEL632]
MGLNSSTHSDSSSTSDSSDDEVAIALPINPDMSDPQVAFYNHSGFTWNDPKADWVPHTHSSVAIPTPAAAVPSDPAFSITTYNVWFESSTLRPRTEAILKLCFGDPQTLSDVICFQEATHLFLKLLCEQPVVRANYWISDTVPSAKAISWAGYGCIVCIRKTRFNVSRRHIAKVETRMGRHLYLVEATPLFQVPSGVDKQPVFRILTSHFESLNYSAQLRAKQRVSAKQLLLSTMDSRKSYYVLACGDFNLTEDTEEDAPQQLGFSDAWEDFHKNRGDGTLPSGFTINVNYESQIYSPKRFDRIVWLPAGGYFKALDVTEFGTESVAKVLSDDSKTGFPSDHLGVRAVLRMFPAV